MNVCFLAESLCDRRMFGRQIVAATAAGHNGTFADLTSDDSIEVHRDLAQLLPTTRLEIEPDAAHLSKLDQPDALAPALVQWLIFCTKQIQTQEGTHEYQHA